MRDFPPFLSTAAVGSALTTALSIGHLQDLAVVASSTATIFAAAVSLWRATRLKPRRKKQTKVVRGHRLQPGIPVKPTK